MARRRNPKKAETGLLTFKFLATAAGLWFAYSMYKRKTKAVELEEAAAAERLRAARRAGTAEGLLTDTAGNLINRYAGQSGLSSDGFMPGY